MDHQDDAAIIEDATVDLRKFKVSLHSAEARTSFLAQYKRAKLEMIVQSDPFTDYEIVKDEQMPTMETTLAAWLIRNQAKAMLSEKQVFLDFRAPIEIEALMVSDDVL